MAEGCARCAELEAAALEYLRANLAHCPDDPERWPASVRRLMRAQMALTDALNGTTTELVL